MVNNIIRYFKLYRYLIKFSAMLETEYRFSFLLEIIVEILFFIATMISFTVLFNHVFDIAGWNRYQVMILYGFNMVFCELILGAAFIFNLRELPYKIIKGDLDLILVKPVNSLFASTLWRPYFASIPSAVSGIIVMIIGFYQGNIPFNPLNLIPFTFLYIFGLIIAYSLSTIISCLSFWFQNADPLPYLAQQFIFLAKHPFDIYTGIWRTIFLLFIPTAFMVSLPTKTLLGYFQVWWIIVGALVAAVFFCICRFVWQLGLKSYESASA